jgi:DNA-binding XRE family transcriptional regulator
LVGKPPNAKVVEMKTGKPKAKVEANNVLQIREGLLMSKAELARRAGLSVLTIDRVEKGMTCRMDTKRKIILALGLQVSDRYKVFGKKD